MKPAQFQSRVASGEVSRIEPNSKWFGKHIIIVLVKVNNYSMKFWLRAVKY